MKKIMIINILAVVFSASAFAGTQKDCDMLHKQVTADLIKVVKSTKDASFMELLLKGGSGSVDVYSLSSEEKDRLGKIAEAKSSAFKGALAKATCKSSIQAVEKIKAAFNKKDFQGAVLTLNFMNGLNGLMEALEKKAPGKPAPPKKPKPQPAPEDQAAADDGNNGEVVNGATPPPAKEAPAMEIGPDGYPIIDDENPVVPRGKFSYRYSRWGKLEPNRPLKRSEWQKIFDGEAKLVNGEFTLTPGAGVPPRPPALSCKQIRKNLHYCRTVQHPGSSCPRTTQRLLNCEKQQ